jgi:hypothetical protein
MQCAVGGCYTKLFYFFCSKCKSLIRYPNFKMGSETKCPRCSFRVCYVRCTCGKIERYPPGRSYEGEIWKCNSCSRAIQYVTCDNCLRPRYSDSGTFGKNDEFICGEKEIPWQTELDLKLPEKFRTAGCGEMMVHKKCENCSQHFVESKKDESTCCLNCHITRVGSKVREQRREEDKTTSELNLCKICLDKDSEYVNLKCFHLCICGECLQSLGKKCPICRQSGEYHKVFKA